MLSGRVVRQEVGASKRGTEMIDADLLNTLSSLSTPLLVDARLRLGLPEGDLDPGIRPVVPFSRMVGTAVTVRLEVARDETSADFGLLTQAYESGRGSLASIIVIQVPEELGRYGIVGEVAAVRARARGFVGALVEGAVRDTDDLRRLKFPVYSRTIAPGNIGGKVTAVDISGPVHVGGRAIHPGDLIVADNDGVVVIRPDRIGDVVAMAVAIKGWEGRLSRVLAEGIGYDEAAERAGPRPESPPQS